MNELKIVRMIADYHKECNAAETLREKGDIQLKHARLIRKALTTKTYKPMMYYEFRPKDSSLYYANNKGVVLAESEQEAFELISKLTDIELELSATYDVKPTVVFCSILPF